MLQRLISILNGTSLCRRSLCLVLLLVPVLSAPAAADGQTRPASSDEELKRWLQNMIWYHQYSDAEVQDVTGLTADELSARRKEFGITSENRPARTADRMLVLPYPGGRHPRIGFLDGAIDPQRETKLSVFCPWDDHSYVVLDIPEAIWSNLGLTYLAHTHVPTIWSKQNIALPQQEWTINTDGSFEIDRRLPNGVEFGVKVIPQRDHLRMKMRLTNGTDQPLSDLRVQNCVMLKAAEGFDQQHNDNKKFENGYAVAHSPDKTRWIISGWDPVHRAWGNAPCPCLHSDPKFPDCPPGETRWLRGWFSFFEGSDIDAELARIEGTGWRRHPLHHVTGNVVGRVQDANTGKLLPCRLYAHSLTDGQHHFATSTAVEGSAVVYDKQLARTNSTERHTTLSADPFQLQLPSGKYRLRAEHGKEFVQAETVIEVPAVGQTAERTAAETRQPESRIHVTLSLQRFADMGKLGWYSGDTHVHRRMEELPNAVLAEDLNVALPLNYWVRDSTEIPATSTQVPPDLTPEPIVVDPQHVICPVNTEYEIFTVNRRRHTQGAVFVLNHKTPLNLPAPPTRPVAEEARRQGALLDLDKHSWNWSLMIVPVMNVDLFELSNNHHWRTAFGFPQWTLENAPPNWPEIERSDDGFTELGWTEFGFQTYYTLLNCGFRMRVTGGTASGVHPVPLGYGRVYVHCDQEFSHANWMKNLNAGRSFVTQGPLADLRFNDQLPGTTFSRTATENTIRVTGRIDSVRPLKSLEIIHNGTVAATVVPENTTTEIGAVRNIIAESITMSGSGWLAVRCFEQTPDDKVCFAHTNPVFIDVPNQPVRPRKDRVQFLVDRMDAEIRRNDGILDDTALAEFRQARQIYADLLQQAR